MASKVGTQIFLLVSKSQIRKFLGSFRNVKFANFIDVSVRKSQIWKEKGDVSDPHLH
jgi:hypothetical protein